MLRLVPERVTIAAGWYCKKRKARVNIHARLQRERERNVVALTRLGCYGRPKGSDCSDCPARTMWTSDDCSDLISCSGGCCKAWTLLSIRFTSVGGLSKPSSSSCCCYYCRDKGACTSSCCGCYCRNCCQSRSWSSVIETFCVFGWRAFSSARSSRRLARATASWAFSTCLTAKFLRGGTKLT